MNHPLRYDLEDVNRRLRGALTAFFLRRTANPAEADDLVQEVFIRLARERSAKVEAPDSYVFAIAANLLRDRARRERVRASYREAKQLEDYVGIDPIDPFQIAAGRQTLNQLAEAIAELPDKTRRIFILYRIENIEKRVIAESFGLTVRMVEIHIQRALLALADKVDTNN